MRLGRGTVVVLIAVSALVTACAQGNLPQPVQAAVADLAQRLNINQDAVTVASFKEVTWPDASLGNPEEGRIYAQVQTPGYQAYLEADGRRYEYHTDRGRRVALVDSREMNGDLTPEEEVRARITAIAQARQYLVQQLGVEPDEAFMAVIEERTWPNAALGVEDPGQTYAGIVTRGYRMIFEVDGELHYLHADMSGGVKPARATDTAGEEPAVALAVDAAIVDLAGRLGIAPGEIIVADVEQVQWPNGSLGLPDPGMMYTMMLVSGERIVLQAKGRTFEYRKGGGEAVQYAGVIYPEDADVSILAMGPVEPADGNNFFHLQRIDPDTRQQETVVEFVSDFVATADGRDVVIKRRTSRSGHVLVHIGPDGVGTELDRAFDFTGLALRHDGEMLATWGRASVMDRAPRLQIRAHLAGENRLIEPAIPGVGRDEFTAGEFAWMNEGLAFTVRTNVGARSFYWTPDEGARELGAFAIVGWIPGSKSLLIRRAENNQEVLATFIPGTGETAVLANAPSVQSVDAPRNETWVVAVVSHGGAPRIERITWGGSVISQVNLPGAERANVRVSPLGELLVVEYAQADAMRVDLIDLEGGAAPQTLTDVVGAVPVVD